MAYDSYKLLNGSSSSFRNKMMEDKRKQVSFLYENAFDRENEALLNGIPFVKSPRVFERKFIDSIHHKITVETIAEEDFIQCGDYLEFDGMHWLCLNSYSFHGLYCKATFMSCDWKLYWQSPSGDIKSIYVIDQNSTQYNSGEAGNSTIILGAAQHMLKMQCTDDTILFDTPMRFSIDRNIHRPTCYKVTQNDNSAYNYGKGICCVTVTETQKNNTTDKLITLDDGSQVWICDYHSPPTPPIVSTTPEETTYLSASITGGNTIRCGRNKTWTSVFADSNGNNVITSDFNWNIVSKFQITQINDGSKIKLRIDDDSLIGESFLLQLIRNGVVITETEITVIEGF